MSEQSKLWYLENIRLFKGLPNREMMFIMKKTIMRKSVKNQYIYFPEDPSSTIYFLKKGRVKIGTYSPDGKEIIKAILQPGEIFGELGIMGEERRTDFAQAMDKDVILCAMSLNDMEEMMQLSPNLSLKVIKLIGLRFKRIERKFESLVFKDTRARMIEFIKDLAEEIGKKIGDEIFIKHDLTHQEIGNLTAIARQTVTSILNELEQKNIISMDRNTMIIRDINKLK